MDARRSLLALLLITPLLYFIVQSATVLDQSNSHNTNPLTVDHCQFGDDICLISYQKQTIRLQYLNGVTTSEPMQIRLDYLLK